MGGLRKRQGHARTHTPTHAPTHARAYCRILCNRRNHFLGPLPEQLGSLGRLADLNLEDNAFTGRVPLGLCKLLELKELWLNDNRLSGCVCPAVDDDDGGVHAECLTNK